MIYSAVKSIPILAVGMLLFSGLPVQGGEELPRRLFQQEEWELCLRECRRASLAGDASPRTELLEILSRHRLHQTDAGQTVCALARLISQTEDPAAASAAAYETGRLEWGQNHLQPALDAFAFSFQSTTNRTLFLQSACSAFLLLEENPKLKSGRNDLIHQINTTRAKWYGALFSSCRLDQDKSSIWKQPAYWLVGFYRQQISPAIGQRCNLEPSCSEYFRRAAQKHGPLMAVPMAADRFFREPGLNAQQINPVVVNGKVRYGDSLDDHDYWMTP
jgi:putative component of membrane protein insertase Oxa1/YidC/SpoIIIJ protein YidD